MIAQSLIAAAGLLSSVAALPSSPVSRSTGLETRDNSRLVIYWGAEDDSTTLDDVCNDDAYSIVALAFVDKFFADGGYPSLAVSGLYDTTQAQQDAGATSLKDGSPIVDAIKNCQGKGKPVILSVGGAGADVTLSGDDDANKIADTLWNLFLGGTEDADLRPFGDVKLDGIDLDNESGNPTGYATLASRLRSNFGNDTSKQYFLTAAPQCPYPDASQPPDVCSQLDYVWVQFYNNGDCNVAQSGFIDAVNTWSSNIGNATLFIGGIASAADGDQGYIDADTFNGAIQQVKDLNLPNYGGAMLWEAQLAVQNNNYQEQIVGSI